MALCAAETGAQGAAQKRASARHPRVGVKRRLLRAWNVFFAAPGVVTRAWSMVRSARTMACVRSASSPGRSGAVTLSSTEAPSSSSAASTVAVLCGFSMSRNLVHSPRSRLLRASQRRARVPV